METVTSQENKAICRKYRGLLKLCKTRYEGNNLKLIRKAFDTAISAHKNQRRGSGEPFVYHPIEVAKIVAGEIGLGTTSVVSALLHDVVEENSDFTISFIKDLFGETIAKIVDGLTKIKKIQDKTLPLNDPTNTIISTQNKDISSQAENYRKIILTLTDDIRVILVKLADRLHNMRTLDFLPRYKQLKISSETMYFYAPIAHRLGLYAIKTELEDLAFGFFEPEMYKEIKQKLAETEEGRKLFIQRFSLPIINRMTDENFKFEIRGRTKSIYSIWKKIKTKDIPFEEIYDLFAVRIIIDTPREREKDDCWRVYSIITDIYPNTNIARLRDWISVPKTNGYESLHVTVLAEKGKWVEFQIRSRRMDEIAEKGLAAHWKYKDPTAPESQIERWIKNVREILENPETNAIEFVDTFKLSLFTKEINVFTPAGDVITLPKDSTVLDFAFQIHTDLGLHCISAKVNQKLVPINHILKTGDTVEIITSKKQTPNEDWLRFVITSKAKTKIRAALNREIKKTADEGKILLERKLRRLKVDFNQSLVEELTNYFKLPNSQELFYRVAKKNISNDNLRKFVNDKNSPWYRQIPQIPKKIIQTFPSLRQEKHIPKTEPKPDILIIGDGQTNLKYSLASCCNPIPGDEIFGFISIDDGVKIHKISCPNAINLMSNFSHRLIKARWASKESIPFISIIHIEGIDNIGILHKITGIIAEEFNVNMKAIDLKGEAGIFKGNIMLYINDTEHLNELINRIKKIDGVKGVKRIDALG